MSTIMTESISSARDRLQHGYRLKGAGIQTRQASKTVTLSRTGIFSERRRQVESVEDKFVPCYELTDEPGQGTAYRDLKYICNRAQADRLQDEGWTLVAGREGTLQKPVAERKRTYLTSNAALYKDRLGYAEQHAAGYILAK